MMDGKVNYNLGLNTYRYTDNNLPYSFVHVLGIA